MTKILLDTHILLWWLNDDRKLSKQGREMIIEPSHIIFLSAAVVWELRIKAALKKVSIPKKFFEVLAEEGFESLSMSVEHAHLAGSLPRIHNDPFDRMLIAQAKLDEMQFLTHDETLSRYDANVVLV